MIEVTFGKLIIGFEDWLKANIAEIRSCFTPDLQDFYGDDFEGFAVDLFFQTVP